MNAGTNTNLKCTRVCAVGVTALLTLAVGCGGMEWDEMEDEFDDDDSVILAQEEGERSVFSGCASVGYGNCVKYAHCRQPRLPGGLWTFEDKIRLARTRKFNGHHGCVAIIKTSRVWGHVAYVRYRKNGILHIAETNWAHKGVGYRQGTRSALNIHGFFCPED